MRAPSGSGLDTGVVRLGVLGLILALCLGVILYLLTDVREKLTELGSSRQDNIQWTLTQLEVEFLKFETAIMEAQLALAPTPQPPDPAHLAEVRTRYDILYSRFETLSRGRAYLQALGDPSVTVSFDAIRARVYGMVPLIDGADTRLARALPDLHGTLTGSRQEIRRILSIANQVMVAQSDRAREGVFQVLRGLALATLGLITVLCAMVVLFRQLALIARRRLDQGREAAARLETIFRTSRDAIVVLDPDGHLRSANRAAQLMFGFSEAQIREVAAGDFLRREDALEPVRGADLFEACAGGAHTGYRLSGYRVDGGRFPIELSMTATDNDGPVLVCVIRDISHQVAIEAQLKASRDQALAGERAKARFLGVISHEMRTPLNGILGTLDLVQEAPDSSDCTAYLGVVRNSAETLLQLVNDVLDITQIEGGDVTIHRAPFNLDALIDDILTSEKPRAMKAGNRLFRSGLTQAGWVTGDATRLRQVLLNLVSNAVKFTEGGEIEVTLAREETQMVFRVRDTGIGMSAEERERIFDDFVRLDGAVHRQIQGTGLGLGIARQLTLAMGGRISVSSRPEVGSLFTLELPLPAAAPARPDRREDLPVAQRALDILLVEDNPTNRFVARRMLERDGHHVTEAEDGAQGVAASAAQRFDVILMDVSMPVMDGYEATRAIRSGPGASADSRIVALTAHVGGDIAESLRAAGMDDVIAKPIRAQVLRRLLAEAACDGPQSGRRQGRRNEAG
ncbi:hybrid sensor histidine kinase/response regulator [Pseudooceanicola endophyticus]|uniref:hybrid sensor histidine kinase/response regulator n=1 Tax=Pseudooceanicola endophyticus TaxID=2841273 RepID=UPI001C01B3FB|nr:ATP-binding protein [Pseudooceanicola endophyticus]